MHYRVRRSCVCVRVHRRTKTCSGSRQRERIAAAPFMRSRYHRVTLAVHWEGGGAKHYLFILNDQFHITQMVTCFVLPPEPSHSNHRVIYWPERLNWRHDLGHLGQNLWYIWIDFQNLLYIQMNGKLYRYGLRYGVMKFDSHSGMKTSTNCMKLNHL